MAETSCLRGMTATCHTPRSSDSTGCRCQGSARWRDSPRARCDRVRHLPLVSRMMHVDFGTYLPEDILTKVDRMSMAHSIESRVPLLDHPLVEFALRLPLGLKLRDGQRKFLLKRVAARLLPGAILERKKQGFG